MWYQCLEYINRGNSLIISLLLSQTSTNFSSVNSCIWLKINLVFVFNSYHIRSYVNQLVVNSNKLSVNLNSCMMDRGSNSALQNSSLQSSLQKFVDGKGKNIIQSVLLLFIKKTILEHFSQKSITFKNSSLIVFFECQKLSCSLS